MLEVVCAALSLYSPQPTEAGVRVWLLVIAVCLLTGCSRARYRNWADRETYPIVTERILQPQYDIGRTEVIPDPASRLFDPFDLDHPPKPPDDPSAGVFMAQPNGMRGARNWDKDGVTDQIEPDGWELALGLDEKGVLYLNQDKAVDLALLDSREYQTAIEDVYLAALALTLNRFEFALQWFGTNSTAFTHFGSGGAPQETNTLSSTSKLGFTRNFAAGGQLLVDFANSLVFEYTNGSKRWSSNLTFQFLQPLLRGAGRKVRLENLTQQERNVLYSVRTFARFRKQFWAGIAVQNGGYLDLLLATQTLRNNQDNLKRQEETFRLYNETFLAGRSSPLARDQSFQQVLLARASVIQAEIALQNLLDAYKLKLGIPPRVPVELDASLLNVLVLTDSDLDQLRVEMEAFQRNRFAELDAPPTIDVLKEHFQTLQKLSEKLPPLIARAEAGVAEWKRELDVAPGIEVDQDLRAQTEKTYRDLKKQVPEITADLKRVQEAIERHLTDKTEVEPEKVWESLIEDINALMVQVDAVISVQSQTKVYRIKLPVVQLTEEQSLDFAKTYRLDLQNQLAQVTDSWRKVWVAANVLRGTFNINATANVATDPTHPHPLDFASNASLYTVGFQFDGPLNRLAERNAYRASLINFQRAKRSYMALSDVVEQQIRRDLRQLRQVRLNFEISRQSLLVATRQVESARLALINPDRAAQNTDTLATTNQLLTALGNLVNARNALAGTYINYEQQRVQLLLDLEALQLDERGFPTIESLQFKIPEFTNNVEEIPPGIPSPDGLKPLGDAGSDQSIPPPVVVEPELLPRP
jgi:outer membrane protein TolC